MNCDSYPGDSQQVQQGSVILNHFLFDFLEQLLYCDIKRQIPWSGPYEAPRFDVSDYGDVYK